MSRSNTNYYNICEGIGPSGVCEYHEMFPHSACVPPGKFHGRRDWVRKKRFPNWTWKRFCKSPPRFAKRLWERKLRAQQKRELARHGEVLVDAQKKLAGLYGYWS